MSEEEKIPSRNFDLSSFKKVTQRMIATSNSAYQSIYDRTRVSSVKNYTKEEIEEIIASGSLPEQQRLSRNYFYKDGFYKQIITYYATLLKYAGILIPNVAYNKKLKTDNIKKQYYKAIDYVEKMRLSVLLTNCAQRALVDGSYYGVIIQSGKDGFALIDLPSGYACSNFKDIYGNDIVEFNLAYFNTILDKESREAAFAAYPLDFKKQYNLWIKGKRKTSWYRLAAGVGICFPFFDGRPLFLDVIPSTIQYDKAVEIEQERDLEEIRKIIVQKIPHLTDGRLLFEPEEAEEMHIGAVGMMKNNPNVSVLTSYADVDAIVSKTAADATNNSLERMLKNIYSKAGVSSQIFSSTGSSTLDASIRYDISLMMYFANKCALLVTNIINQNFANGNINFKYTILPVSQQNEDKYVDMALKLANSGYSFLIPAIAMGQSQRDILGIKELENDVLGLKDMLIPLSTSYTQSNASDNRGRPQKEQSEKAQKTIENETSLDRQAEGEDK